MPDTSTYLSQLYVKIEDIDAPESLMHDLLETTIETSLHLPDVATMILNDPRLHWIDDASLAPGKTLKISAKANGNDAPLFEGEIVELEPDFSPSTQRLVVRAFDRLHRLSRGRHVRSFVNVSDADLVRKIGQELGLYAQVGPNSQIHPYVLQSNQTNLEFLQTRAAALGYLLYVHGKTLHCDAMGRDGQPVELEWGRTLGEFHPRMTTIEQVNGVIVRGWDPAARQEIVGQAQNGQGAPKVGESRSGGEVAQDAFKVTAQGLVTNRPIRSQAAADRLAQAVADRKATRFIEAQASCGGNPAITAGASVRIKAVGNRFGGTYFVTSAVHVYNAAHGFTTQFSVSGLHPETLLSLLASDRDTTPTGGLVIGIVTDNQDPDGQGRVKVKFPWLSGDHASDWARVATPGGGAQRGIEFLPEINDEVLIGFEQNDMNYPYVLGGLWNGKDAPPKKNGEVVSGGHVQQRIIRSRSGHVITLDDSDSGGGITIQDRNGNTIVLDTSSNALNIQLKGDGSVKVQGNLTLEAQGQIEMKGMGVKIDGGAGTVDIKGSIVNLN
jgi:phage protein D/phage baseplate assembly protein gpV